MNPRKYIPFLVLYCTLFSTISLYSEPIEQAGYNQDNPSKKKTKTTLIAKKRKKITLTDKNDSSMPIATSSIEQIAQDLLEICKQLDYAFNNMAMIVANNQVSIDKKQIIQKIMESRTIISMIMNSAQAELANPQQLSIFLATVDMVVEQINVAVQSNLVNFPALALESVIAKKSDNKEVTLEDLQSHSNLIKRKSASLKKDSENVGLSRVNIAFRALERFNKNYHIGTITEKALWFSGIAAIGIYLINKEMFKKSMIFMGATETGKKTSLIGNKNSSKSSSKLDTDAAIEANNAFNGKPMDLGLDFESMKWPLRAIFQPLGWLKNKTGDELIPNLGASNTPNRGEFTRVHVLATAIFAFGMRKIELGQMAERHVVETWNYFKTKFLQARAKVAAKLRGGPAYEVTDQRMLMKNPTRTLEDVIGNDQIKKQLQPLIDYIVNYEQYDRKGLIPETGILFCGPPRTGKTFMGEAIAGSVRKKLAELGRAERLSFVTITPSLMKNWGDGPASVALNIQKFFFEARSMGPIIIFIDELDTGRFQRDGDSQAVEGLLAALSQLNIDKSEKVIFIGATNTPENIDVALRQSGRFGTSIYFDYPTFEQRFEFMHQALAKKAVVMDREFIQFLYHLAKEADKATFDTLELAITAAHMQAHAQGVSLNQAVLEEAIDRKLRNIQKEDLNTMDEQSQMIVAHHLAGQIVLNSQLFEPSIISKATIYPRAPKVEEKFIYQRYDKDAKKMTKNAPLRYGKVFKTKFVSRTTIASTERFVNQAKFYLAGSLAEQVLMGSSSFSHKSDEIQKAAKIAEKIVFEGQNKEMLSKKALAVFQDKAQALLEQWKNEVMTILSTNISLLTTISTALRNHKILPGRIIDLIIERYEDPEIQEFISMSNKRSQLPGAHSLSLKQLAEGLQTIVEDNPA